MFFSGFLMSYSYKEIQSIKDYKDYIKKKALKFVPAYLFFSLVFLFFEQVLHGFDYVKLRQDLIDVFFYPSKAPAGFLWYIYVLFQFYLSFPFLKRIPTSGLFIALVISIILQFFEIGSFLNLDLFKFYLVFILLGILSTNYINQYYNFIRKAGLAFTLFFVFSICMHSMYDVPKLIFGILSIPVIHFIAIKLARFRIDKILITIGQHSYYIYLMNTLIMGSFYLLFVKTLGFGFTIPLIILFFFLGLFLPIALYKRIIKPNKFLNKIIK
jgi:peptidoglycan/LPS O-acetylase OafA/YrhL